MVCHRSGREVVDAGVWGASWIAFRRAQCVDGRLTDAQRTTAASRGVDAVQGDGWCSTR